MPPIFKALATITAWVLFISGWIFIVWPLLMNIVTGNLVAGPPTWTFYAGMGIGVVSLILAVCAMRLRQKME